MNKAEVNRLGVRLRNEGLTSEILTALDTYRRSFQEAAAQVHDALERLAKERNEARQWVLRPSKATPSIIAKLIRQPTLKLSQVQDIAGMRLIVYGRKSQEQWCQIVCNLYPDHKILDRREKPSFGYRALHIVIKTHGLPMEIQLRTTYEHAWACLSEDCADALGHEFKYGKSNHHDYAKMLELSDDIHRFENRVENLSELVSELAKVQRNPQFDERFQQVDEQLKLFRIGLKSSYDDLLSSLRP